jgi:hypothetical protein
MFCRRSVDTGVPPGRRFLQPLNTSPRLGNRMTTDISSQPGKLGLGRACLYWLLCSTLLAGMGCAAWALHSMPLAYAAGLYYLVAGFFLSRVVLRGLVLWLPYYYTLTNVTGTKLHFFFMWPLAYLALFFRLAVNKVL